MKKISLILFGLVLVGFVLFKITIYSVGQKNTYVEYGLNLNEKREEVGLEKLSKDWEPQFYNEISHIEDMPIEKLVKVFSFKNIRSSISYEVSSPKHNPYYLGKHTGINSNIFFLKNGIISETDVYEKEIDSLITEIIDITYFFKDVNGNKNYFMANHSIINSKEIYFCGTPEYMEYEEQRISGNPFYGNITKKQADSILYKWRLD